MVTIKNSVNINRSPEDVFTFVTDPANEPSWHTDVLEAKRTSSGPMGVGATIEFTISFMGRKTINLVVRDYDPPRRMVVATTSTGPMMPTFTFSFEPAEGGTRFTREGEIRTGGLMKLMEPMMRGMAAKRADGFLANLKRMLEKAPADKL